MWRARNPYPSQQTQFPSVEGDSQYRYNVHTRKKHGHPSFLHVELSSQPTPQLIWNFTPEITTANLSVASRHSQSQVNTGPWHSTMQYLGRAWDGTSFSEETGGQHLGSFLAWGICCACHLCGGARGQRCGSTLPRENGLDYCDSM